MMVLGSVLAFCRIQKASEAVKLQDTAERSCNGDLV